MKLTGPLIYTACPPIRWRRPRCSTTFAKGNDKLVIKGGAMANLRHGRRWRQGTGLDAEPRGTAVQHFSARCRHRSPSSFRTLNEVPGKFVRTLAALRDEPKSSCLIVQIKQSSRATARMCIRMNQEFRSWL
jgi:large subunit ribosomal protein L10